MVVYDVHATNVEDAEAAMSFLRHDFFFSAVLREVCVMCVCACAFSILGLAFSFVFSRSGAMIRWLEGRRVCRGGSSLSKYIFTSIIPTKSKDVVEGKGPQCRRTEA